MSFGHVPIAVAAVAIAILAVFVALDLADRARQSPDRLSARLWSCAGAGAMGTGVWSMHFVGMSAVDYPFAAGFEFTRTFVSWAMAGAVCLLPMWIAASPKHCGRLELWICAGLLGAGAVAMHLVGASAMAMSPIPKYDYLWLSAAFAVATAGSGLALSTIAGRRESGGSSSRLRSAALMGGGLIGMHFLAMAASSQDPGAICLSRDGIEAHSLSWIVGSVTVAFLGMMLLMSGLEKRAQRISAELHTSLAVAREEIKRATLVDAVTGLQNRLMFQQTLKHAAVRADANGGSFAVLLIDIDGFERLRREITPELCDTALRACASRLVDANGSTRHVASAGSHQFLILVELAGADSQSALTMATRVALEMRAPFDIGTATRLTASVGISIYPADGAMERVVGNASVAMESVKARGGNGYAFFEQRMDGDAHVATELLDDLRLAAELGQLALHYQPKIHAASNQIAGVEALLRWSHPTRGMVGPDTFIPLAERFGLINEIGDWVVAEAVRQMAHWSTEGVLLRVAINVSPGQLLQPDFACGVVNALARGGVDARLLTCEITETAAMQDTEATMATFKRLEAAGVKLSIDDFGTGIRASATCARSLCVS